MNKPKLKLWMMGIVVVIVWLPGILLIACQPKTVVVEKEVTREVGYAPAPVGTAEVVGFGETVNVHRFVDRDFGVVCYASSAGMACVKLAREDLR